ncbi:MAG: response regulator [Planctomycetota bacterium]|nr:MAG: response regulator [Planctomycetota bacterium]
MLTSRRQSFLSGLILLTSLAILLPIIGMTVWLDSHTRSQALHQAQLMAEQQAMGLGRAVEGLLAEPIQHLLWLTLTPEIREIMDNPVGNRDRVQPILEAFLRRQIPSLQAVALFDDSGRRLGTSARGELQIPAPAHREPWFVGAMSEVAIPGGLAPVHIRHDDMHSLRYSVAVLRPDNTITGIALVDTSIPALMQGLLQHGHVLLDRNQDPIVNNGYDKERDVVSGAATVRLRGHPAIHWQIRVDIPHDRVLADVSRALQFLFLVGALAILIAAILVTWAVLTIGRPLTRLTNWVQDLQKHGLRGHWPPDSGPLEIHSIATALGQLQRTVREREQEIAAGSETLRIVAEFAADWELWIDPAGECLHCSPSCLEISGYDSRELCDNPSLLWTLMSPEDHNRIQDILAQMDFEEVRLINWQLIRRDGGVRRIEQVTRRIRGREGQDRGWRSTLRDVTRRHEYEMRLRHTHRIEEIGRLSGGVAHDVNNFLAIIGGQAEMLTLEQGPSQRLKIIQETVERGASLTRQLLVLSRRQVGDKEAVECGKMVEDIAELLRHSLGAGIQLKVTRPQHKIYTRCAKTELEQVLVNVINNARDAMPDGGTLELFLGKTLKGGPCIKITDSGPGIPREVCERIFEPYFTTKAEGKGTGLGLAMAQAIIEASEGVIQVASELGRGTTFTIELPPSLPPTPTPQVVTASYRRADATYPLSGRRILVADDNSDFRQVLKEALERMGAVVLDVEDGSAAIAAFEEDSQITDAVLDIRMPGQSGISVGRLIRKQRPTVRVILMTGDVGEEANELIDGEQQSLLRKPFPSNQLINLLLQEEQI